MSASRLPIALIGAGGIGRPHAERMLRHPDVSLSGIADPTPAPWNHDLGAGELERFPQQDSDAIYLCGTEGSLTLPQLQLSRYAGVRGWAEPLTQERTAPMRTDPCDEQLRHLRAVVEGREAPLVAGRDALATLRCALAVHEAARSGAAVAL